eukprot:UN10579
MPPCESDSTLKFNFASDCRLQVQAENICLTVGKENVATHDRRPS